MTRRYRGNNNLSVYFLSSVPACPAGRAGQARFCLLPLKPIKRQDIGRMIALKESFIQGLYLSIRHKNNRKMRLKHSFML